MSDIHTVEQISEIADRAIKHPGSRCPECGARYHDTWWAGSVIYDLCTSHEALRKKYDDLMALFTAEHNL